MIPYLVAHPCKGHIEEFPSPHPLSGQDTRPVASDSGNPIDEIDD